MNYKSDFGGPPRPQPKPKPQAQASKATTNTVTSPNASRNAGTKSNDLGPRIMVLLEMLNTSTPELQPDDNASPIDQVEARLRLLIEREKSTSAKHHDEISRISMVLGLQTQNDTAAATTQIIQNVEECRKFARSLQRTIRGTPSVPKSSEAPNGLLGLIEETKKLADQSSASFNDLSAMREDVAQLAKLTSFFPNTIDSTKSNLESDVSRIYRMTNDLLSLMSTLQREQGLKDQQTRSMLVELARLANIDLRSETDSPNVSQMAFRKLSTELNCIHGAIDTLQVALMQPPNSARSEIPIPASVTLTSLAQFSTQPNASKKEIADDGNRQLIELRNTLLKLPLTRDIPMNSNESLIDYIKRMLGAAQVRDQKLTESVLELENALDGIVKRIMEVAPVGDMTGSPLTKLDTAVKALTTYTQQIQASDEQARKLEVKRIEEERLLLSDLVQLITKRAGHLVQKAPTPIETLALTIPVILKSSIQPHPSPPTAPAAPPSDPKAAPRAATQDLEEIAVLLDKVEMESREKDELIRAMEEHVESMLRQLTRWQYNKVEDNADLEPFERLDLHLRGLISFADSLATSLRTQDLTRVVVRNKTLVVVEKLEAATQKLTTRPQDLDDERLIDILDKKVADVISRIRDSPRSFGVPSISDAAQPMATPPAAKAPIKSTKR
eukprot:c25708_g1_i1.p1 GENE.c25708_g1_i1~~c25708_g1_i1.p1  ORF type:complete len:699 (-),score=131.86 c25708_g1_i1:73-2085(-)